MKYFISHEEKTHLSFFADNIFGNFTVDGTSISHLKVKNLTNHISKEYIS